MAFGTSRNADAAAMPDLNVREIISLGSIAAVVLWMGVYPESFLAPMRNDIGALVARVERAKPSFESPFSEAKAMAAEPKAAEGHH